MKGFALTSLQDLPQNNHPASLPANIWSLYINSSFMDNTCSWTCATSIQKLIRLHPRGLVGVKSTEKSHTQEYAEKSKTFWPRGHAHVDLYCPGGLIQDPSFVSRGDGPPHQSA